MGSQLPLKGAQPLVFGPCLLWPNGGWMKTSLGTEVDLGPGHIVLDAGTQLPREKGTAVPVSFRPMSIVVTVAHLIYC